MSQENVDVMRRANASFNARDWAALIELYHPDVELRDLQHAPDIPEVVRGPRALDRVVATWSEVYDEFGAEVCDYIDTDPWLICDASCHGKVKGSDVPISLRVADAYEINDGKI